MTVASFWRFTRTHLVLLLAATTLGALVAFGITWRQPVVYTADAAAYVATDNGDGLTDVSTAQRIAEEKAAAYLPLVTSRAVAARVVAALDLEETPEEVASRFGGEVETDSVILRVTADGSTPEQARDLAGAVIDALAAEAQALEDIGRKEGAASASAVQVVPFESAVLPTSPSSPVYPLNLAVGAILGLALGYGAAYWRRAADSRLRSVTEAEEATGASVVGVVPRTPGLQGPRRAQAGGPGVESLRQLRTNLRFVDVDHPPRSIVITSANAGEGKSTLCANLGRLLADAGQSTVIVDADLRRPTQHEIWGVDAGVGLTQALAGDATIDEMIQPTGVDGLGVVTAGRIPPNPSELLGSQRMRDLLTHLARDHIVLLDAPPLLPVTDAGLLTAQSDGALLVFAVGRTYREQAAVCKRGLDQVGGRTLGVVLNMAPPGGMGAVVYGYGYGSYRQEEYTRTAYASTSGESRSGRRRGSSGARAAERSGRGRRRTRD